MESIRKSKNGAAIISKLLQRDRGIKFWYSFLLTEQYYYEWNNNYDRKFPWVDLSIFLLLCLTSILSWKYFSDSRLKSKEG